MISVVPRNGTATTIPRRLFIRIFLLCVRRRRPNRPLLKQWNYLFHYLEYKCSFHDIDIFYENCDRSKLWCILMFLCPQLAETKINKPNIEFCHRLCHNCSYSSQTSSIFFCLFFYDSFSLCNCKCKNWSSFFLLFDLTFCFVCSYRAK